jgi:hypothetical protein
MQSQSTGRIGMIEVIQAAQPMMINVAAIVSLRPSNGHCLLLLADGREIVVTASYERVKELIDQVSNGGFVSDLDQQS